MKRIAIFVCTILLASVAWGQTTAPQCAQATSSPSNQLTGSPTCTASSCTYTDSTPVDGATYAYVAVASDVAGQSCSNIVLNVTIPATGAHTVALTFVPSTTPNITYAIFRATPPANPTGLSATVN